MSDPMLIRYLLLRQRSGLYNLKVVLATGEESESVTDGNLGHITSAFSAMLRELQAQRTGETGERNTVMRTGSMNLDRYTIEPLTVAPWAYKMDMQCGRFRYTVNIDRNLEHLIKAYEAAMKFFAMKTGLIVLDDEVARNYDRAGELGFLN